MNGNAGESPSDMQSSGNGLSHETGVDLNNAGISVSSMKEEPVESERIGGEEGRTEGAVVMDLNNGVKEKVQDTYVGAESDCTVANRMEEIRSFSERASETDCDGAAARGKGKLIANGRFGADGESSKGRGNKNETATGKKSMQRREVTGNARPPALVIPPHREEESNTVSSNGHVSLPLSLVCSPNTGESNSKVLDPNAPEFTPSSPCRYSPHHAGLSPPMLHLGIPSPYLVDTHYAYGTGIDIGSVLYAAPISDLNAVNSANQCHPAVAPRACYGPAPPPWEAGNGESSSAHMPGQVPSPRLGVQPCSFPFVRAGAATTGDGREQYVSRSLLLSEVPTEVDDQELHKHLSFWGPVRSLDLDRRSEGIVLVHYYDIRHSQAALRDIKQQKQDGECRQMNDCMNAGTAQDGAKGLIGGKPILAQYAALSAGMAGCNQGTLVLFNLDADVSLDDLRRTFENFGAVKDLRGVPSKLHKFIEFYDSRDAARAFEALDGQEICGKRVKIEFSRSSAGQARRGRTNGQNAAPLNNTIRTSPAVPGYNFNSNARPLQWNSEHPAPLGVGGHMWGNYGQMAALHLIPEMQQALWYGGVRNGQIQSLPYNMMPSDHANEKGFSSNGSPDASSSSFSVRRRTANDTNAEVPCFADPMENGGIHFGPGRTGLTPKSSPRDLCAHYVFDENEALLNHAAPRTTLMVRNIPNKYSQPMLLALLDQHCLECNNRIADSGDVQSAYDFVYLPIDFKNRCNLGYAFVNFTSVQATLRFYKAFHLQLWEAFNSRKICQITYARVQGRAALEDHFRNSRFACDTDKYLPVIFSPPRNGIQCPTPTVVAAGHQAGGRNSSSNSPKNLDCCSRNDDVDNNNIVINSITSKQSSEASQR